ncbi:MAG: isoprenylcysteine carboxylmethyltransferase family protein [Anaerolineales bacterium]|jgi:protein-S-isoprenylcysteine O-methyltransferase Ste14
MPHDDLIEKGANSRMMLPRWVVPIQWAAIVLVIMILAPWAASLVGPHYGWTEDGAGWINRAGLLAVALGLGMYAWSLVFHFRTYSQSVAMGFSPPELVIAGPYRISRNPMYVAGLFAWLGWTLYYGSPVVLTVFVFLWLLFSLRVIPSEERQLEALFGEDYLVYKRSVRRWIGQY